MKSNEESLSQILISRILFLLVILAMAGYTLQDYVNSQRTADTPTPTTTATAAVSTSSQDALEILTTIDTNNHTTLDEYDRDSFGAAWVDPNNACDTRNRILARDLTKGLLKV